MKDRMDENAATSIQEQAAEWFIRLHNGELTVAERYACLQWLKTSPVHIAELLRVCRMYSGMVAMELPLYYANKDTSTNVVELKPRNAAAPDATHRLSTWRGRIAAGVAVLIVALLFGNVAKVAWLERTLETKASEWRVFTLADGSVVRAGPRTELRHAFGDDRRLVHLTRGRAVFQVAKDPSRPFIVDADIALIKAIGTRFEVRHLNGGQVRVIVSAGSVDVVHGDGAGTQAVSLAANQKVVASSAGITLVPSADVERDLAWAGRWLEFADSTVREAVDEFNDLNRVQIVVAAELTELPVRGAFEADDPESFVQAVALATKSRVEHSEPDVLRLEPPQEQR